MPTSTDRCEYCGAPGPFKAGACYGCIQLINLAQDLSVMQARLTHITLRLDETPTDRQPLRELDLITQDLTQILAQIDRYTNA